MHKYSVLQYIFNNYDVYRPPKIFDPECEYILVTDDKNIKAENVKIIIDDTLNNLPIWYKCYSVRFNLFKYCSTPVCFYLDGNVEIKESLNKIYQSFIDSKSELGLLIHPERNSIIHEYFTWHKIRNYPLERAIYILNYFISQGYNINYKGLYEGKFRICKNTELNNKIDTQCLQELQKLSYNNDVERIDQTVYSLILNNFYNNLKVMPIFPHVLYNSGMFNIYPHNENIPYKNMIEFPYYYLFDKKIKL